MKRWLCALCVASALGITGACEGTETGNPDPSHELDDAGAVFDGGAPHHSDGGAAQRDAAVARDAGVSADAGAAMDAGEGEDAGQENEDSDR